MSDIRLISSETFKDSLLKKLHGKSKVIITPKKIVPSQNLNVIYLYESPKGGFSFKVYSELAEIKTVALCFNRGGSNKIGFESIPHYEHFLKNRNSTILNNWINFLKKVRSKGNSKREYIDIISIFLQIDLLADCICSLKRE